MWRGLIVIFFIFHRSIGALDDDVVSVESLRRDVRGALLFATEVEDLLGQGNTPANDHASKKRMKNASGKSDEGGYFKTYGSDAEGEKGYLKATFSKGNHGYKNLDTFHKQDGDKYAFEKHVAYCKTRDGKKSGHNAASGGYSKGGDHEGAGTIVDSHYTTDEDSGEHDDGDHGAYSEGSHYTDHGPESSNYGHSEGYATNDGDHGSYESHSSYSKSYGDEQGDQGGHYY